MKEKDDVVGGFAMSNRAVAAVSRRGPLMLSTITGDCFVVLVVDTHWRERSKKICR